MRDGELRPGDKCDRYQIVRLIAAGGMGEVYEAVHEFTARPVALKCLQLRHANKDDLKDRMKMEAIVLCRLRHANIVTVYDAGITDRGMVWIAMDLLVGKTLREIVHRIGRLSIPQALYYACEIADGVDAAHELRVVHRDLKPENVFVTERNEVKVLDLGTAKFYGYGLKTTDRMRTLGTPAYMSPEHIQGTPVDARTDIYALGLILYEMLAGHHVYAKDGVLPNSLEMGTAQLFQEPPPLTDLIQGFPEYLWAIVRRSIAKKREERHTAMGEFAGEMRAARQRYVSEENARGAFGLTVGDIPASKPGARRGYLPPRPPPEIIAVAVDDAPKVVPPPSALMAQPANIAIRPPTATVRLDAGAPPPAVAAMAPTVQVETTPAEAQGRSPSDPRALPTVLSHGRSAEPAGPRVSAPARRVAYGDDPISSRDGPTPPPMSSTATPPVANRFSPMLALFIGSGVGITTAILGAVLWARGVTAHRPMDAAAAEPTVAAEAQIAPPAPTPAPTPEPAAASVATPPAGAPLPTSSAAVAAATAEASRSAPRPPAARPAPAPPNTASKSAATSPTPVTPHKAAGEALPGSGL